ncbi:alpha/beta hydrolase [Thioclava sp. GXIMD4216]|uniref:alpha/beta fold hydrolase n=1 Tax=Thioclava sp. GXIMD4216 TaxID=3131929 RepID=UPI0030D09E22
MSLSKPCQKRSIDCSIVARPRASLHLHEDTVALSQAKLHFIETGEANRPTLVFLHGWPLDASSCYALMSRTSDSCRCIAVDLPGIWKSAFEASNGSKAFLAGVIHEFIETLGLSYVVLIGHDVGGMIAYAYL